MGLKERVDLRYSANTIQSNCTTREVLFGVVIVAGESVTELGTALGEPFRTHFGEAEIHLLATEKHGHACQWCVYRPLQFCVCMGW